MNDLRKKLYNLFDPSPCKRELYVSLDEVRGTTGLVKRLADDIRLSDGFVCKLLAGHTGSGKSTELLRLQRDLECGENRYLVVLFDAVKRNIDPLDVDFPDVLLSIISNLTEQLNEREGINLDPGYIKNLLSNIKDLLGARIDFTNFELNAGLLKLSGSIKENPSFRMKLRSKISGLTEQWIEAANATIRDAQTKVKEKNYTELVIIVDGLDKILMNPNPNEKSSAENLFGNWHAQLRSFQCHMLYTMPIALAYSGTERSIAANFGITSPPVVPMTKLYNDQGKPAQGFKNFREIINKRLQSVGATMTHLFKDGDKTADLLIQQSGGQPRDLMVLLREAILEGDLPLERKAIEVGAQKITNSYRRQLRQEHWSEIEIVREHHRLMRTEKNDRICMDLLDSRAVLQYTNGEEWYNLNPLLPDNPEA